MRLDQPELLKTLREAIGVSQAELARRLDIDRSYYSRMERGDRPIDVHLLLQIAALGGVKVVVISPEEDIIVADLHQLSPPDTALIHQLVTLLPTLHPLRKADLIALLDLWRRSSPSKTVDLKSLVEGG